MISLKVIEKIGSGAIGLDHELVFVYKELLQKIERAEYESVSAALHEMRESGSRDETRTAIRSLLSARLALKEGNLSFDLQILQFPRLKNTYLQAEACFVRGLFSYQTSDWSAGEKEFTRAADLYRSVGEKDRVLLSRYNSVMGRESLDGPLQVRMQEWISIQREAEEIGSHKFLALIIRQKSYLLYESKRYGAALAEMERIIESLELYAANSDYQLGRIHMADCCLSLGDEKSARLHLEYVLHPLDVRVQFPFAYMEGRLNHKDVNPRNYSFVLPHWKQRSEAWFVKDNSKDHQERLLWNAILGELRDPKGTSLCKIRFKSREGLLLDVLRKQPVSKALLIEKLWPEAGSSSTVDNRLHRLVSRVNQKTQNLVAFDGQNYRLQRELALV